MPSICKHTVAPSATTSDALRVAAPPPVLVVAAARLARPRGAVTPPADLPCDAIGFARKRRVGGAMRWALYHSDGALSSTFGADRSEAEAAAAAGGLVLREDDVLVRAAPEPAKFDPLPRLAVLEARVPAIVTAAEALDGLREYQALSSRNPERGDWPEAKEDQCVDRVLDIEDALFERLIAAPDMTAQQRVEALKVVNDDFEEQSEGYSFHELQARLLRRIENDLREKGVPVTEIPPAGTEKIRHLVAEYMRTRDAVNADLSDDETPEWVAVRAAHSVAEDDVDAFRLNTLDECVVLAELCFEDSTYLDGSPMGFDNCSARTWVENILRTLPDIAARAGRAPSVEARTCSEIAAHIRAICDNPDGRIDADDMERDDVRRMCMDLANRMPVLAAPAPAEDCPAAALIAPFAEATRASIAAGELEVKAKTSAASGRLLVANERVWAFEAMATTVQATSLQGAMLSLLLAANHAASILDFDMDTAGAKQASDKALRMIFSAQRVFELVPGAAPDPTLRADYMSDRMDPWREVGA